MHVGVVLAGLRIAFRLIDGANAQHVFVRINRLAAAVELEIGDGFRIGRPPESGRKIELFGIHPIEAAVDQRGRSAVGQAGFLLRSDVDVNTGRSLVETPPFSPSGESCGIELDFRGLGDLVPFAGIDVNQEQVAGGFVEDRFPVVGPLDAAGNAGAAIGPVERRRFRQAA